MLFFITTMVTQSAATYFTLSGIFGLSVIALLVASKVYLKAKDVVFGLAVFVPAVACVAYFAAANGFGFISTGDGVVNGFRYLDWLITTPILMYLLAYSMFTDYEEQMKKIFQWVGLILLTVISGFIAELLIGNLKALFFVISSVSYLTLLYLIVDRLLVLDSTDLSDRQQYFSLLMAWTILVLWTAYPFVWIFGPSGVSVFGLTGELLAFGVLDVLTKVGFAVLLLKYLSIQLRQRDNSNSS